VIAEPVLRQDFQESVQKTLKDPEFTPDHEYAQKVTTKKRYIADHGIIVSGPTEHFDDVVKVDWNLDADRNITVTIKTRRWTQQIR